MSWFRSLKEEKIRTFFSEDYPQFLIEVYNELLKYENNPYNKNIKLLQLLLRRCEQLYIDVQIKYYKIDKNLDMFKNEIDFFAVTKIFVMSYNSITVTNLSNLALVEPNCLFTKLLNMKH